MEKTAVFPGSFDPFTLGHKVVVEQALGVFDRVVIAVGVNSGKQGLFTPENRVRLIRDIFAGDSRIEVKAYYGLTADFCKEEGINFILRGLRNSVDFEYERNIAQINHELYPKLQTVVLFTPAKYVAISSSAIREMVTFGGDPSGFMPAGINLKNYLREEI